MTPATQRVAEAVLNAALTHSGNPDLARHVGNAVANVDTRGTRIVKEHKDSKLRIDLAVAAVMAFAVAVAPTPTSQIWVFDPDRLRSRSPTRAVRSRRALSGQTGNDRSDKQSGARCCWPPRLPGTRSGPQAVDSNRDGPRDQ